MKNLFYLILFSTLLSSCAISRKIPYNNLTIDLPQINTKSLSIAVWDQREQVIKGSRKPDFVGYMRSGAGIAYPMGTLSGKAFAEDIALNIYSSFNKNEINVSVINTSYKENENNVLRNLVSSSNDKLILLKCNQLHTDGYNSQALQYNLKILIYDKNGKLINQKSFIGTKEFARRGSYKVYMPNGLNELIKEIFNDKTVFNALNINHVNKNNSINSETEVSKKSVENQKRNNIINNADVIYKTDGTEIISKVIEISENGIKYKFYEQLDGPLRNISKQDVFMIIYKDGTREVFGK